MQALLKRLACLVPRCRCCRLHGLGSIGCVCCCTWLRIKWVLYCLVFLCAAYTLAGCAHRQPISEPMRAKSALTLITHPSVMIRPGPVNLTVRLSEGADIDRYSCAAVQWSYGDNEASLHQVLTNCEGIPRVWTVQHRYRRFGEFKPAFYLRSQVDGSILAWAEATILVQKTEED